MTIYKSVTTAATGSILSRPPGRDVPRLRFRSVVGLRAWAQTLARARETVGSPRSPERSTGYSTISLPCIQGWIAQMNRSVVPAWAVTRALMTGSSGVIRMESPG